MDGLIPWLLERKEKDGDAIDARLYSYALGLQALPLSLA
jgi:ADP-ribose pyrophosphatase/ADP-sugar pyrophosphatase/8-oxo-dGDP phosphatase